MESFGHSFTTKKRSFASRRPRTDYHDNLLLASTPPSSSVCKASSDDNSGYGASAPKKELCLDRIGGNNYFRDSEVASQSPGSDNKLRKVKLKVGAVTRTIRRTSTSDGTSVSGSSFTKSSHSSDASHPLHNQDSSDENLSSSMGKGSGYSGKKEDSFRRKISQGSVSVKPSNKDKEVRKSKRLPKKQLIGGEFSDGEDDEEIQYLQKLKYSKVSANFGAEFEDEDEEANQRHRKISRVLKRSVDGGYNVNKGDHGSSISGKGGRRSRSGGMFEDDDYVEEEEPVSDGEPESKRKKQRKEVIDVSGDSKGKMALTRRQRALQNGDKVSSGSGGSLIEFANGLPPVPSKKQKEKLSEVELQLKKVEAAQRRRMQVEKAARESEAEAIRKILGQDSSRKKREDKMKKRREELAHERAVNAMTLASNTVRWIMGPSGTVVTFPNEMGMPSVFDSKPCRYPPPREKCAGPLCSNPYKYRDSKLKLPLCSLQCYKAIQEKMQPLTAC